MSCGSFSARASAAVPMAMTAPDPESMAIADGSSSTMPRPATQMSVLTVPRSIATLPRMRIIAYLLSPPDAPCAGCAGIEYGAGPFPAPVRATPGRPEFTARDQLLTQWST